MKEQKHLNFEDTINYGSYYTPPLIVDFVYEIISKNIKNLKDYVFLDTSCGYGNFLRFKNSIGADIDKKAIQVASKEHPDCKFFLHDSLKNVKRSQYGLSDSDKIITIGNPPYNDTTSIVRKKIKTETANPDNELKHRDVGISFLRSYEKLSSDYVCVLHPLSYLIKKTNFNSLKNFKDNYKLIDGLIISSAEFSATSKSTSFPIIIALYKKEECGMDYDYILDFSFKTKEGNTLRLREFDNISNYLSKYPNHNTVKSEETVANFWTMRDINALKRSKSFIAKESYNAIRVTKEKFSLYCYVDIFKNYINHIPYYMGNCDVMINYPEFKKLEDIFISKSIESHSFLSGIKIKHCSSQEDGKKIEEYFKSILGEHYVD